ncbi:hypothetical protein WDW86_12045, partial [Bdellovibrionota bacterium FG-2]
DKYNQYGYHTGADFLEFGHRIGIGERASQQFLEKTKKKKEDILALVERCYLSVAMKKKYFEELRGRFERLFERP